MCRGGSSSRRQIFAIDWLTFSRPRGGCVRSATRRGKKRDPLDCHVLRWAPPENPLRSENRDRKLPGEVCRCSQYPKILKLCRKPRRRCTHDDRRKPASPANWILGRYRGCREGRGQRFARPKPWDGAGQLHLSREAHSKPESHSNSSLGSRASRRRSRFRLCVSALGLFAQVCEGCGGLRLNKNGHVS